MAYFWEEGTPPNFPTEKSDDFLVKIMPRFIPWIPAPLWRKSIINTELSMWKKEPEGLNNDRSFNCRTSVLQNMPFFNSYGLWCQPTILLLHIEIHFDLNLVGRLRNHGVSSQFVHVAYTCCNSKSSSKPMEISQMLPVPVTLLYGKWKTNTPKKKIT